MENKLKGFFNIGRILFYTSLFLLPSALSIAIIFLLISLIINFITNPKDNKKDKLNIILYIGCIFLFLSSAINFFTNPEISQSSNNQYLTFIGLLNWLPHVLLFQGCQKYLITTMERKKSMIILILGSIPVMFSCFSQALLNWHGPFKTFFGLIIWYQRPIHTGITGLFNNPNYLAAWLHIILPFTLALLYFDNKNYIKFIFKLLLSTSIAFLIILTASRAALLFLLVTLPLIYGSKFKKLLLTFYASLSIIILNLNLPLFGDGFKNLLKLTIPEGIWLNFTSQAYETLDISRIGIWKNALKFIQERPIWGNGSNAFSRLLADETGFWRGHSHNLPLELIVSYGIPAALLILIPITYLLFKSYVKVFFKIKKINKETIIDRAWIVSLFVLILAHLFDIQYFDGRISITGWILLAGTKNIIFENIENNHLKKGNAY